MTHRTGTFVGQGNLELFYQAWLPDAPRAAVVLAHGYAEHSGRYAHVAAALNQAGYAVWALDHRGHGRSQGPRANIERFEYYSADLGAFVRLVRAESAGLPMFLLGHSMGGLIAAAYALEQPGGLKGLVLTAPAFKVDEGVSPILIALSRLISVIAPNAAVGPFDPTGVSRDQAVVDAYVNDPLNYVGKVKARMGRQFLEASRATLPRVGGITLPVLMAQGESDRLISPSGTYAAFETIGSADKTLKKYPGLYHEVLNEPEQAEILALINGWIGERL